MAEPVGRPTKYKEEYAFQAEKLCRLGATDKEMADFFNIESWLSREAETTLRTQR